MDIKDSYLHGTVGVVKSISVAADKLSYKLADVAGTTKTVTLPLATQSANGLLSKEDKTKLDNMIATKVANDLILKIDSGTTEGTSLYTYNGSAAKTLDIKSGTGIAFSKTAGALQIFNSGVRSIATGTANGTISVNTNGTSADIAVKGLGSAAYTSSDQYVIWNNGPDIYYNIYQKSNNKDGYVRVLYNDVNNQSVFGYGYSPTNESCYITNYKKGYDLRLADSLYYRNKTIAYTDSNITGNAATADKLKTKRKLWGLDFDGTADVSGNMTGVGNISMAGDLTILSGNTDKYITFDTEISEHTNSWRIGYLGTGSGNGNYFVLQSTQTTPNTWTSALTITNETLESTFAATVTAPTFKGNLDGSYVNKLTNYTKATIIGSIAATDSLNTALGKLEYKADTAYDLVKGAYDGDGTIENLAEILKVLEGIKDTETIQAIIGKYLPLAGGTLTGNYLNIGGINNADNAFFRILNNTSSVNNYGTHLFHYKNNIYQGLIIGSTFGLEYSDNGTNYKVNHSGNTYINNGTITINGTSITPLTLHLDLTRYFKESRGNINQNDLNTFESRHSGTYNVYVHDSNGNLSYSYPLICFYNPGSSGSALELTSNYSNTELKVRTAVDNKRFTDWKTIAFTDSNITGNAATANSLKVTSCTYNGAPAKVWNTIKVTSSPLRFNVYDSYNEGGPSTYGNIIEIVGIHNHWQPQLWFDAYAGGYLRHRNKGYDDNTWGDWHIILDSNNYGSYLGYIGTTSVLKTSATLNLTGIGTISMGNKISSSSTSFLINADGSKELFYYNASGPYLSIGYGSAGAGYPTYIHGNKVQLRYGQSASNGAVLDSTGNFGIGTTEPTHKLHVKGSTRLEGNNSILSFSPDYTDTWSDGTNSHPWYGYDHRYAATGVYSTTISDYFGLTLRTGSGNLSMTTGGNVGIGTYNPTAKLQVEGGITMTGTLLLYIHNIKSAKYNWALTSGKWYRIMVSDSNSVADSTGELVIYLHNAGSPSTLKLSFGVSYHNYPFLFCNWATAWSGTSITKARIVYRNPYGNLKAYLEVYANQTMTHETTFSFLGTGWALMTPTATTEAYTENLNSKCEISITSGTTRFSNDVYAPNFIGTVAWSNISGKPNIPNPTSYYWANVGVSSTSSNTTAPIFGNVRIGGTKTLSSAWKNGLVVGPDGSDKVVMTYLDSSTDGATIGAHNSDLSDWSVLNVSGSSIYFRSKEAVKMTMTSAGDFGIGTTSPSYKLDVSGGARFSYALANYYRYAHWGSNLPHASGNAWYNVYSSTINTAGDNIILKLSHSYYYTQTDSVIFAINVGYGTASITLLNSTGGSKIFKKVRVRFVSSATVYVDVQIYSNVANTDSIYVSGTGTGTFRAPTATSDTAGTIKEIDVFYSGLYATDAKIDTLNSGTPITSANIGSQSVSNADTTDGVHLEWAGSQAASSTDWLAGWTSDGKKLKAVKRADLSVNYAASAGNADTVDSCHKDDFLRRTDTLGFLNKFVLEDIPKGVTQVGSIGWTDYQNYPHAGGLWMTLRGTSSLRTALILFPSYSMSSPPILYSSVDGGAWQGGYQLAYKSQIPTTMAWGSITGKPSTFTPSSHTHSYITDAGNGTAIYAQYSSGGWTSNPDWLCAWSGYKITYVSPSNVSVGYASSAGSVAWANVSGKPTIPTVSSRNLTVNGTAYTFYSNTTTAAASFYAPTSVGSSYQILVSGGSTSYPTPYWENRMTSTFPGIIWIGYVYRSTRGSTYWYAVREGGYATVSLAISLPTSSNNYLLALQSSTHTILGGTCSIRAQWNAGKDGGQSTEGPLYAYSTVDVSKIEEAGPDVFVTSVYGGKFYLKAMRASDANNSSYYFDGLAYTGAGKDTNALPLARINVILFGY